MFYNCTPPMGDGARRKWLFENLIIYKFYGFRFNIYQQKRNCNQFGHIFFEYMYMSRQQFAWTHKFVIFIFAISYCSNYIWFWSRSLKEFRHANNGSSKIITGNDYKNVLTFFVSNTDFSETIHNEKLIKDIGINKISYTNRFMNN